MDRLTKLNCMFNKALDKANYYMSKGGLINMEKSNRYQQIAFRLLHWKLNYTAI